MKRTVLFLWFTLLFVWVAMKFGSRIQFVEKFHRHHCKLEWTQATGPLEEVHLICPETGKSVGEVWHRSSGLWAASSDKGWNHLMDDFATKEQAIQAVEKYQ